LFPGAAKTPALLASQGIGVFWLNSSNTTYLTIDDTGHRHHRSIIIPTDTSIRTGEEGGCDVDFEVDFGFFFGESTSAEENGDEKEISSDGEASPHTTTDSPGETNTLLKCCFLSTKFSGMVCSSQDFLMRESQDVGKNVILIALKLIMEWAEDSSIISGGSFQQESFIEIQRCFHDNQLAENVFGVSRHLGTL
jgi:hypothetical protein